ncbi:polyisoprenoid-binding protein YceI [Pseudonocardia hierapolitana]|uniref:Polyisoprenoid-binding protein YceI n=1 Tax=Pseudonocardia hierapolitana TaxID=1128676 RepID=A0A561T590_9PSEU|nr:YceI family protein [Pseudonocardia hierapolitana]TWF82281.1 polyisoprenoid-binding protein YceI [Pseudonocardia hierapolitana]
MSIEIPAGRYALDPVHSSLQFAARFVAARVRGTFGGLSGALEIADDLAKSAVQVQIDLATLSTGVGARDDHLRSADYFDTANHPAATFVSTGLVEDGDRFLLAGDLTIRGATRPVELEVRFTGDGEDQTGAFRVGFAASGRVSRSAFGVNGNVSAAGGPLLVGDTAEITLELQAVRES